VNSLPCAVRLSLYIRMCRSFMSSFSNSISVQLSLLQKASVPYITHRIHPTFKMTSQSSQDISEPLDLTFGIELEFFVVYPGDYFPYNEDDDRAVKRIFSLLLEKDINIVHDAGDHTYTHTSWRIKEDELDLSERENDRVPKGYFLESVELVSRKFHFYDDAWRGEITRVLNIIKDLETQSWRFLTSTKTGFHVHIGNNDSGFPLQTAKNVYTLATAFERCFDSLHTMPRIKHVDNDYCSPPSKFFRKGRFVDRESRSLMGWLTQIEDAQTFPDFGKLFILPAPRWQKANSDYDGHSSAYNFDNLFANEGRREENLTRTIEFRQHAGTLQTQDIFPWIKAVVRVVEWAHSIGEKELERLCNGKMYDRSFKIEQLFQVIQLDPLVMEWYVSKLSTSHNRAGEYQQDVIENELDEDFKPLVEVIEGLRYKHSNVVAVLGTIEIKFEHGLYGAWNTSGGPLFPNLLSIDRTDTDDEVESEEDYAEE